MLTAGVVEMARIARLTSALADTHADTETVHRTLSMLRIVLFDSLL